MPYKLMTAILIGALYSQLSFGHGEDKLGPNKGYIRMPGAFHTEVVPAGSNFKVYLLDIEFKNPTVESSTVEYTLKQRDDEVRNSCTPSRNHFICEVPMGKTLSTGELQIKATRNNATGGIVSYKLPLKLEKHH